MTMEPLVLQLEEPGDDPLSDEILDILSDALQPGSNTSADEAAAQITALLPKGHPNSDEVISLVMTCYEIAEQTPHHHPSMVKLVAILDLCLNSARFDGAETLRDWWNSMRICESYYSDPEVDFSIASDADESPAKYVNFQTFVALVIQCSLIEGSVLPIFTVTRALEQAEGETPEGRNACVQAAMRYLALRGEAMYRDLTSDDTRQFWNRPQHERHLTEAQWKHDKWRRWYEHVRAIATEHNTDDKKTSEFSDEAVELAGQAMTVMEGIGGLKTG